MAPRSVSRGLPTGCLTCRIRRIKCDEARPFCRKCTSTGRRCDGYSEIPFSRDELRAASQRSLLAAHSRDPSGNLLVQTLISDATFRNATEKRFFQYFRQCTVKDTNLVVPKPDNCAPESPLISPQIDSRFWDQVVLQASHAEPAVKHAVLALGSYHSFSVQKNDNDAARQTLQCADEQYLRALGEAKVLVANASSQQTERVLMVCVLFIIYEGMRGNYAASQAHMDNARAIAAQNRRSTKETVVRNRLSEVFGTMARLDILALNFSDMAAPYQHSLDDFMATAPDLQPTRFSDLQHASASLVDILRLRFVLGYDSIVGELAKNPALVAERESEGKAARERLSLWARHWNQLMSTRPLYRWTPPALHMECWFTMAEVIFDTGLTGPETRFDAALDKFARVVDLGERIVSAIANDDPAPTFSLDLGFVVPLFLTAVRCRDPHIRRRAVRVLESHDRREGIYASKPAAAIAMRWIYAEESGLEKVETASDVPVERRISMVHVQVDWPGSKARLEFHSVGTRQAYEASRVEHVRWE